MKLRVNENIFRLIKEEGDATSLENMFQKYSQAKDEKMRNLLWNMMIGIHGEDKVRGYERYKMGKFKDRTNNKFDDLLGEKSVNISNRGIEDLGVELESLRHITELKAENNSIDVLPQSIGELTELQTLDLTHNLIQAIPFEIGKLQNLRNLVMNNNLLNALPNSIGNLGSLHALALNNNFITELPKTITNCENLKFLYLSNNRIQRLPDGFEQLNLTELDLSDNPISPEYMAQLQEKMPRTTISYSKYPQ